VISGIYEKVTSKHLGYLVGELESDFTSSGRKEFQTYVAINTNLREVFGEVIFKGWTLL
jgi:hypothetical protein